MSLTACADVPIKPIVNRCEIDKAASICRCHLTGGAPGPTVDEPLEFCDGFVAHSLDDTGKMDDYAHKMENYIKANCGGPTNPN